MRLTRATTVVIMLVTLPGCATIVGGGPSQPVRFESTPSSATFSVKSSSGLQMGQGTTPSTISLPRKNEYQVQITMPGYEPQTTVLTKGINGWLWGNLLVGWVVGFAIDFITGSAHKLEPSLVQVTMQRVGDETFGLVRFLDENGRVVAEQKLRMVPSPL